MDSEIRIVLADDHPVVRQGLRSVIEREPTFTVVGEASDGRAAVECITTYRPDIAIVDISMPTLDGFAVAEEVRAKGLSAKVIVLTIHREQEFFNRATEAGAMGYVLKDCALLEIVASIKAVSAGKHYASPEIVGQIMRQRQRSRDLRERAPGLNDLTVAEKAVLQLVAEYKTSTEIANALHVSPRTVDTHRTHIAEKLGLRGKHALMKFAAAHRDELLQAGSRGMTAGA